MKSTKDLIEEAREMATELERMPLADALAYRAAHARTLNATMPNACYAAGTSRAA